MPDYTHEAITARLAPAEPAVPRKQILLKLPDELVDRLTLLAKTMTQLSGRRITRNMLIVDAMDTWIAECAEHGLLSEVDPVVGYQAAVPTASEREYPLSTKPWLFRGTKPSAVIINGKRMPAHTWRDAYHLILRCCDMEKHEALMGLRNKIAGRKRVFLSDKPDGMDVPIKLTEALYVEAYFDTEYLVRTLKLILDAAGYDYSDISVIVRDTAKEPGIISRIETLCRQRIIHERDLEREPITQQEILDCMLLTAALDREHSVQIKQAMEALAFCSPDIADVAKQNLGELRRLPNLLREDPALLTDYVDLDDRLPEMAAARQALRAIAAANPGQAEYLNAAADILEQYWTPLKYEE